VNQHLSGPYHLVAAAAAVALTVLPLEASFVCCYHSLLLDPASASADPQATQQQELPQVTLHPLQLDV
jgi:hypothetical protein